MFIFMTTHPPGRRLGSSGGASGEPGLGEPVRKQYDTRPQCRPGASPHGGEEAHPEGEPEPVDDQRGAEAAGVGVPEAVAQEGEERCDPGRRRPATMGGP